MCDHFNIDCFCENEYIVLEGEPQKAKAPKRAINHIAHHASTVTRIEELELVQVVHGDGTSFVVPEQAVRAEVLHEIGEETGPRVEQVIDESVHEDPTVESLEGDLSGTCQLKDPLMLEIGTTDTLALVQVDDLQSSLFDEIKKTADEILNEDLHMEAIVIAGEDQEAKTIIESHQFPGEAETELIDEKIMQAIREAVAEAMQSVAPMNKAAAHEKDKVDDNEPLEEIAPEDDNEVDFPKEMTSDVQLSKIPEKIILAPIIDAGPSHDSCAACAQRAAQKLKYSMVQDPSVSLEGTKQLFENYDEAKIDQDVDEIVQIFQDELHFIATELGQDLDKVIGPLARPAAEVVDVIIEGLIEDGGKLSDALNQAVEDAIDTTVDRVVDVADSAVTGTAKVVDGLTNTVNAFIRFIHHAKDTMATEGKSIAFYLFSGDESNSTCPSAVATEEHMLSPTWTNEEADKANVGSFFESMPSGTGKQTPLRWLARGLRNMLAPTKQSANIYLSQWPTCSGLSEWPVSGRPGNQHI